MTVYINNIVRPMTLYSGNVMFFADMCGGSQDVCKFSLDFMPASIYAMP